MHLLSPAFSQRCRSPGTACASGSLCTLDDAASCHLPALLDTSHLDEASRYCTPAYTTAGVRQDFLCEIGNHALRIKLILVIPPSSIKCSLTNVFSNSSVCDYWKSSWYSHMPMGLIRLARVDPHYQSKKMAHCLYVGQALAPSRFLVLCGF